MDDSQKFIALATKLKALESKLTEAKNHVTTVEKQIGPQGPKGDKGEPGKDGRDGRDGSNGSDGADGRDGTAGVGIESVEVTFDNSLVVRLTDGTEIDAGEINVSGEGSKGGSHLTQYVTQRTSTFSSIRTVSSDYLVVSDDSTLLVDASAGVVAIQFPASLDNKGRKLTVKKIDTTAHIVTVLPFGAELIDSETEINITAPYTSLWFQSDGFNWFII
jgi:hypothetical protein